MRLAIPLSIPYGQRLPLAIAVLGFLFLGVFLLYPLFNVFGASLLDPDGERLTLANYTKMLGRPFYRTAILNTLGIGLAATAITTALAVPFAFALARLAVPGKAAILALAALPLVLPSCCSAAPASSPSGCNPGAWASARSTARAASCWSMC